MRSARSLYRLYAVLAVAATAAVAAIVGAVARATSFRPEPVTALLEACRQSLLPDLGLAQVVVLVGGALGVAVVVRGTRSAIRHYYAARRALARVSVVGDLSGPTPARIVADSNAQAFCAGLLRPRIYLSTGALDRLATDELAAVLQHEAHHAARRDPLRLLIAQVVSDALFFVPAMRHLRARYAALAELAADEAAVRRLGDPQPLAAAMLAVGEQPSGAVVGFSPERIDHLLGARPRWELPLSMLLGALITLSGLIAATLLVVGSTQAVQVNASALLVQSCFIIILTVAILIGASMLRTLRHGAAVG